MVPNVSHNLAPDSLAPFFITHQLSFKKYFYLKGRL
jgi:hypothetical protein